MMQQKKANRKGKVCFKCGSENKLSTVQFDDTEVITAQ